MAVIEIYKSEIFLYSSDFVDPTQEEDFNKVIELAKFLERHIGATYLNVNTGALIRLGYDPKHYTVQMVKAAYLAFKEGTREKKPKADQTKFNPIFSKAT